MNKRRILAVAAFIAMALVGGGTSAAADPGPNDFLGVTLVDVCSLNALTITTPMMCENSGAPAAISLGDSYIAGEGGRWANSTASSPS
jgi:hypothetical protein